jgi:hypothetical protein
MTARALSLSSYFPPFVLRTGGAGQCVSYQPSELRSKAPPAALPLMKISLRPADFTVTSLSDHLFLELTGSKPSQNSDLFALKLSSYLSRWVKISLVSKPITRIFQGSQFFSKDYSLKPCCFCAREVLQAQGLGGSSNSGKHETVGGRAL